MKSVTVTKQVHAPLEDVFETLQTLGNHERFTDHALVDWELLGPSKGVGARARVHTKGLGPSDAGEVEIISIDEREWRIIERGTGAGGARQTTGEFALFPLDRNITEVRFTLRFDRLPRGERALAPLIRRVVGRVNQRSLDRLAGLFGGGTAQWA